MNVCAVRISNSTVSPLNIYYFIGQVEMQDIDLPENLLEFWVFDYEGKVIHSKTDTNRNDLIFRMAKQLLGYINMVMPNETLRRISTTNSVEEWLITLNSQKIIVMRKRLEHS